MLDKGSQIVLRGVIVINYAIRPFEMGDIQFLWEMLYQSIYVPEGQLAPSRDILKEQNIEKYLKNWGSKHDHALVAFDGENNPVGAVWIRLLNHENAGYGFIDDATPELGMAIMSQHRGQGLGKRLLYLMIDLARSYGYPALSLSVDPINQTAFGLYEKIGFEKVYQDDGGSWTMKKDF